MNRNPQRWRPEKRDYGNQDILKITDTEKLEELQSYSLFDYVTDVLKDDRNNMLALQNKIQEIERFTNTYANPTPERPLAPIPAVVNSWGYKFRNNLPTPFPFILDQPTSQNYYDEWGNDRPMYLDKTIDNIARAGNFDPNFQQVLNSKRNGFTATSKDTMQHGPSAKFSLLENVDSSKISMMDIMYL